MHMSFGACPASADYSDELGGGFAASGQNGDIGYTSVLYDASNGLATSDANYILGDSDGHIWIGGYGGIIRYDGTSFNRLDVSDGLTSGRGLFEDSAGRIWVGTNDNGVVVLDGRKRIHLTYKEGLPSSSIRVFTEDDEGNIYIGTTEGVCYVDTGMQIHRIDDTRIASERVLRLDKGPDNKIYGQTKSGLVFLIENRKVTGVYNNTDLGMETISTIMADPVNPGKVYIGTGNSVVYHGRFGDPANKMEYISVSPIKTVHWISYDCNRVWVSSIDKLGYLDNSNGFRVLKDIPMNSGIEMTTSDFQGNLWVASSTQGVMKIVANSFVNVNDKADLPEEVTNAVCTYKGKTYIGTDSGIRIIDENNFTEENRLTAQIGTARVRCIQRGIDDDLWIGTYTNGLGLIHLSSNGAITSYTDRNGMPDNEIRCISVTDDGTVLACTNKGLAVIKNGKVSDTFGADNEVKNTVFLTALQTDDGKIFVGTDGDGMYVKDGPNVRRIGRDEGLTSDVILRIRKDEKNDLYWIVTSNSIQYFKDGKIGQVTTFPYNNNYDLYPDKNGNMWVVSSVGLYMTKTVDMINDQISDYRLYSLSNGLRSAPTAQCYCELDDDENLYIPGRSGVCKVNVNLFSEESAPIKAEISSIYCGDEQILPDPDGKYVIPSSGGRIRITVSVLDYSLLNPWVRVFIDGKEDEGLSVARSDLAPLEYTNLEYGNYTLRILVMDATGKNELLNEEYRIIKEPRFFERPFVRLLIVAVIALLAGFIVWRVMTSTIIRNQYDEIKRAKEEAERANTAKTRFLANMSHEIRTPINTIMGMNEMAMREDATGVPKPYFMSMMNYAFDIRNASESLLSLINDLLDMSKIESGKMHLVMQEYDTAEMIRSVVSMIRIRSTEKELTFDVDVDEMLPSRMYGDPGKIKQIVLNLLTNAVKYTVVGGFALSVSMEEREDKECVIRFSVKDTGIGVKKEDMEKLFTAYERLDEQRNSGIQGTGLGLDISRRFAELMGGTLTCESEYGKGSEFILTLKQKIVDMTPVGAFREHDDSEAKGPYVPLFIAPDADVLVVDDNPMNLNVIKGLLKGTRVFVSTASSGEECLEKLKDTRFDIVLLDHMMPGMDGVETVGEIRKDYPDLPVYALTANSASGEEFYKSKGFNGYLAKPVDSRILERTIMKHLPEEMMEKPEIADAVPELTEIPDNLTWIYDTEGISVPDGIRNSGGISNYIFSLELFLDTIDQNAKVIRDSYNEGNIRLYTIKVHSLKSSARIVGALELSKLCEAVEEAGNKEDIAFIDQNADKLLADYEVFKYRLERIHDKEDTSPKEAISESELAKAYKALSDVIPQMDYDAVEMILEELNEYALGAEDDSRIKELKKMLRVFDWDGMESLINGIKDA